MMKLRKKEVCDHHALSYTVKPNLQNLGVNLGKMLVVYLKSLKLKIFYIILFAIYRSWLCIEVKSSYLHGSGGCRFFRSTKRIANGIVKNQNR